ncbi:MULTISPECIES: stage II sporulation protein M [Sphingobacterium]|uniref:stage II sporulation protein M n=1 Tax=Sphingobacterium TaxID=28453 RepID=UPI0010516D2B|nr:MULTISPECIES: stage II sporulation protein M [Sphingobacterium]MCW2261919.1 putative membrane protein SpoIIM required for sporulation [Sphingobacterium kitahiroshimense]NJI75121.1 stage II sporulation protein M [Sphingobacterium sp. B16(2022)]TCR13331.1 putative membrane protein SpoIIM required for sporulation [Sphingobacterium sp. JUb78]
MREASFIERNKEKWLSIENNLSIHVDVNPDELASNYIELTNDLAYAQTFYPESRTKDYLNELAILAHQKIYKDQKASENKLKHFFSYEIPYAVWEMRRPLLFSFLIFLLASIIGFLSAHYDENFVRLILGDAYVDQSIDNIRKGDPAAIYASGNNFGSALAITINNVRVAFLAFTFGVFFSVGTGYILFSNGIMLGAFHYMFYEYGVLQKAMSAIWIHGTIEISVIIIAGGCGLMLGNSFLFPKSYSRMEAFIRAAKLSMKVLASTIPFFILAGTLEGFVTRYYHISMTMCLLIIIITLVMILYYYILRPFQLAKINQWK